MKKLWLAFLGFSLLLVFQYAKAVDFKCFDDCTKKLRYSWSYCQRVCDDDDNYNYNSRSGVLYIPSIDYKCFDDCTNRLGYSWSYCRKMCSY